MTVYIFITHNKDLWSKLDSRHSVYLQSSQQKLRVFIQSRAELFVLKCPEVIKTTQCMTGSQTWWIQNWLEQLRESQLLTLGSLILGQLMVFRKLDFVEEIGEEFVEGSFPCSVLLVLCNIPLSLLVRLVPENCFLQHVSWSTSAAPFMLHHLWRWDHLTNNIQSYSCAVCCHGSRPPCSFSGWGLMLTSVFMDWEFALSAEPLFLLFFF